MHLREFQNQQYSKEKNNEFFYQSTIYLLSFDMDVFFSKRCYERINKIHERSLRLILIDYE